MGRETIQNAIRTMVRRPFLLVSAALFFLVLAVADYFNPLVSLLFGLGTVTKSSPLTGMVTLIQLAVRLLEQPGTVLKIMAAVIVLLAALSVILGFLLSGYLNIARHSAEGEAKKPGEFLEGVSRYFSRMTLMNFGVLGVGALLCIVAMVSAVPAIIGTRAGVESRPELLVPAIFIDILSVAVLFFIFMFFRIYAFFWYPALLTGEKRPFSAGKNAANKYFWKILYGFFLFDLVYLLFQACFLYTGLYSIGSGSGALVIAVLTTIVKWIFWTLFYPTFICFVVSAFSGIRKKMTADAGSQRQK